MPIKSEKPVSQRISPGFACSDSELTARYQRQNTFAKTQLNSSKENFALTSPIILSVKL